VVLLVKEGWVKGVEVGKCKLFDDVGEREDVEK